MPITLVPQDDDGDVANANTYGNDADYILYHAARGRTLSADAEVRKASLVKAFDHIDSYFDWKGEPLNPETQNTEFPREHLYDRNGNLLTGIPAQVLRAQYEYAYRAESAELLTDMRAPTGGIALSRKRTKVGPIETEKYFLNGYGIAVLPSYPAVDIFLERSGLLKQQPGITR